MATDELAGITKQAKNIPMGGNRILCFFGNAIGDFPIVERKRFLRQLGQQMQHGDHLLMGLDMVKDLRILENAYNDTQGVMAAYNKRILAKVNLYLGADINPDTFEHLAFYNGQQGRIEMHLQATDNMEFGLGANQPVVPIARGETIHTASFYKFLPAQIESVAFWGGFTVRAIYRDRKKWYSLVHYIKR